jgi:pilus assembly protein Flp/PilA
MLLYLQTLLSRLTRDQKGQDLTEYALLVALIAIVVVLAVVFFGEQVSTFFTSLGDTVAGWLP